MSALESIYLVLMVLGGVLALSGLIIMKQPNARGAIEKLAPFQTLIGLALLGLAIKLLIRVGPIAMVRALWVDAVPAIAYIGAICSGILLGVVFALSQIASWLPGPPSGAEPPGVAISRKLAPFTMLIGVIMLASAGVLVLARLGLLKYI